MRFRKLQLVLIALCSVYTIRRSLQHWTDAHARQTTLPPETPAAVSASSGRHINDTLSAFSFVQISDLHVSRFHKHGGHYNFLDILKSALPQIRPAVVIATGDLTDAKEMHSFGSQQFQDEWAAYNQALRDAGIIEDSSSRDSNNDDHGVPVWLDLRGNHDCFNVDDWTAPTNYYSRHSATRASGFAHVLHRSFGDYLFVGLDACPRRGIKRPFNFFGILDSQDMDDIEAAHALAPNANHTFWFAHYPLGVMHAESLSARGSSLQTLAQRASTSMCGHLHRGKWGLGDTMYTQSSGGAPGLLELELGDVKRHGVYRVVVVDDDVIGFTDATVRTAPDTPLPTDDEELSKAKYPGQVRARLADRPTVAQPPVLVVTHPKDGRFVIPRREPIARRRSDGQRPIRLFAFSAGNNVSFVVTLDGTPMDTKPRFEGTPGSSMPLWTIPWDPSMYEAAASLPAIHTLRIVATDHATNLTSTHETVFRMDGKRVSLKRTSGEWFVAVHFDHAILRALLAGWIPLAILLVSAKIFVLVLGPIKYASWFHGMSHRLVAADARALASKQRRGRTCGPAQPGPWATLTWGLGATWVRHCELARRSSVWYPLALSLALVAAGPLLVGDFVSGFNHTPAVVGTTSAVITPRPWQFQALYAAGLYLDDSWHPVADAWLFAMFKVWQVYWPFAMYVSFNAVPPQYLYAPGNPRRDRPFHSWWVIRLAVLLIVAYHVQNYLALAVFYGSRCVTQSPLGWVYLWMGATLARSMLRPWKPVPVEIDASLQVRLLALQSGRRVE
ncbi:Metallo-dependent phosphatase-like protein, partial [Blastocladiella britannica]